MVLSAVACAFYIILLYIATGDSGLHRDFIPDLSLVLDERLISFLQMLHIRRLSTFLCLSAFFHLQPKYLLIHELKLKMCFIFARIVKSITVLVY